MPIKSRQISFAPSVPSGGIQRAKRDRERAQLGVVSNFLQDWQKKKAEEDVRLSEELAFDTKLTAENIVNKSIIEDWNALREEVNKKRTYTKFLTSEDWQDISAAKQALLVKINAAQSMVKGFEEAKTKAGSAPSKFNLATDDYQEVLKGLESGDLSLDDIVKYNFSQDYNTNQPFLNYKPQDPQKVIDDAIAGYKSKFGAKGTKYIDTRQEGDKTITISSQKTDYGPEDDIINYAAATLKQDPDVMNYESYIQDQLTEDQIKEAKEMYPESDTPAMDYYVTNQVKGSEKVKPQVQKTVTTKPVKEGAGGGGLSIFFGGGEAPAGAIKPTDDKVEGETVKDYVEFGKRRDKVKTIKGVTVTNAQRLTGGAGEQKDLTRPKDYEVIGLGLDDDMIYFREKLGPNVFVTYRAPRQDNEYFLQGLLTDEDREMLKGKGSKKQGAQESDLESFVDELGGSVRK